MLQIWLVEHLLASMQDCIQWDELFISVSYHPSEYKTDIHSSTFMPSQWTVVPSFHLPHSRSVVVLFIEYSIQSGSFHTSHSFFFELTSIDQICIRYIFQILPQFRLSEWLLMAEAQSSIPGWCVWDLWRKNWHWARVYFYVFHRHLSFDKHWTLALGSVIQLCYHN